MSKSARVTPVNWALAVTESCEATACAARAIERIMNEGAEILYDHYLMGMSVPFTAKAIAAQVVGIAEAIYIRRDLGETCNWCDDDEPQPAVIDCWASGRIPLKRKVVVKEASPSQTSLAESLGSDLSQTPTVSMKQVKAVRRNRTVEPPAKEYELIVLDEPIEEEPEFDEVNRQRIELKAIANKKAADLKKREQREALEAARKVERDQEQLAKKALTYDYEGKLIFTKPAVLSNAIFLPRFAVQAAEATAKPKRVASTGITELKEKRAPLKEVQFVKAIKAQTVMWDLISPNKGVIMREGSKARGERIDMGRMSRKDYMKRAKASRLDSFNDSQELSSLKEPSRNSKEPSIPTAISDVPDYELPNESEMFSMNSALLPSQPKIIQYRSGDVNFAEDLSEIDQFNMSILQDHDWGSSPQHREVRLPARLPRRPNFKTLHSTHGYKMRFPRERPLNEHLGKRINISYDTESTEVTDQSIQLSFNSKHLSLK